MSDPLNHDRLLDDGFRNRIAAAMQDLDRPESNADIAAALDATPATPLSGAAMQRILRQVRSSISAENVRIGIGGHSEETPPRAAIKTGITPRSASRTSQIPIVAACLALLVVMGVMFHQFRDSDRKPLMGQNRPSAVLRPGELISAADSVRSGSIGQAAASTPIQRVKVGETLSTGPREKRRVTLPDGSILSINEQSRVTIVGQRRVKLLAGEVFVEVVPASLSRNGKIAASDRFVVETPNRSVTALGTKFAVKAQGEATNVVVTQGKVRVSGVEEVIPAGYELIADLTESKSAELRPAKRSAYVLEWVKELMAVAGAIVVPTSEHAGGTITVVDPQGQEMKLSLRKFHVDVHIEDGFARTTIDQTYFNHTWQQLEGTFRFPLPADASLSRLAMYVNGTLMEGGMVERDYGRNVFEQIRHTRRDPALLEWVDGSTFQMRVFPLEARQEKRILLSYTQRLPGDYGRSLYRFPAGHNLEGVREWSTLLRVKGGAGTKWYSPSHLLNGRDDKGDLVIDGREEYGAMDRDLVVELGDKSRPAPMKEDPTWSSCEQDGFQYVMLRHRPELKAETERSPRHWMFLIENSADRNEVLAETQRQIVKTLLENVEHTDTFSIIRAGTQAESFRSKPVECSLDNVAAALQFLKDVAPIGALDLEQALQAVQKQVPRGVGVPPAAEETGRQPAREEATGETPVPRRDTWIVHLGTGIPVLGEHDETTLLRLLPAKVRYVGVAVGKRWSKSFMQTAANHSGGHVTQINPDEAVAWRAFDLLSTLNAPRLTEIAVALSEAGATSEFLLLNNSLAHGQELAAVVRLAKGKVVPKSVTITGKLNGKPYSQIVAVPQSLFVPRSDANLNNHQSAHLPRTWARLEIDRLVSLGSTEHKTQIIELSKSMYVMSPFTSLLVLETEAMYAQFNVDRGRKDHWAMYPAPAQIPVVADQAPAQLSPLEAAKERLQSAQVRAKSAQTNYDRSVADNRHAADLQRLDRLKRTEQAEVKLIQGEVQRIEQANTAAADPVRQAWQSVIRRRSAWQHGYFQNYAAYPTYWGDLGWSDRTLRWDAGGSAKGINDYGIRSINSGDGVMNTDSLTRYLFTTGIHQEMAGIPFPSVSSIGIPSAEVWGDQLTFTGSNGVNGSYILPITDEPLFDFALPQQILANGNLSRFGRQRDLPQILSAQSSPRGWSRQQPQWLAFQTQPTEYYLEDNIQYSPATPSFWRKSGAYYHAPPASMRTRPGPMIAGPGFGVMPMMGNRVLDFETDVRDTQSGPLDFQGQGLDLHRIRNIHLLFAGDHPQLRNNLVRNMWPIQPGDLADPKAINLFKMRLTNSASFSMISDLDLISDFELTSPRIIIQEEEDELLRSFRYRRPYHVAGLHPLAGVLKDLPSYAPGLQTWQADRLAIVEQTAATKPKIGEVDAEARRLIEKSRSLGWEKVRLAPAGLAAGHRTRRDGEALLVDGSGRFVLEREVGEGLMETVIHDGTTLWHLYPEIGLAAQRKFSRFHQSAIQSLIPWYVPSVDDLRIGADLKAVGERTIRITVLKRDLAADSTQPAASRLCDIELVFSDEGRLSESRLIDNATNKLLAKQTVALDGTVRVFNADEKLASEVRYERQAAQAPNLVPATKDLVVLPLPYRSSAGLPVSVPVNLQTNTPDFAKLSDDDASKLLATYFAEARQAELAAFVEQRFTARGDHRIGLAVLLASVFPQNPLVANATKQHPGLPLAKFLEQFAAWVSQGILNGKFDVGDAADPFLKRVSSAYNHHARWVTDQAATRERPAAEIEQELGATLLFIRDCRSLDLAARLLSTVEASLKRTERLNAKFAGQLNQATAMIADERGTPAFGRTARIEWLLTVGDDASVAQAKELLRTDLADSIATNGILELNGETRSAFVKHYQTPEGQPCGPWGELVKQAALDLLKQDRHLALIDVARRCISLGEPALAAQIFPMAIKDQDLTAKPFLNLLALEYAKEAANWVLAEACVRRALADVKLQQAASLWRDAADVAHHLNKFNDWIDFLDRAYELEFAALPKTVNLETFRQDYDKLFGQLEQRTEQLINAPQSEKLAFARMVQRAATRWRDIDVDDTIACHRTARILTKLGFATAAWNYWTTPLAETPDQSTVWQAFAVAMNAEHRFSVTDRAWSTAFACEPTNPELLLQHAQFLRSTHQDKRANELLTKITTSTWQPRFDNIKTQAQALLTSP